MILANTAALLMLVFGNPFEEAPGGGMQFAQVTVRQRILIRVQQGSRPVHSPSMIHWREGRGPRCVPASAVIGATQPGDDSVDLMLRDRSRIRARLARGCNGLDFYRGFYVNGTADGLICADRDAIRSRMGGQCGIDQFRSLTAVRP